MHLHVHFCAAASALAAAQRCTQPVRPLPPLADAQGACRGQSSVDRQQVVDSEGVALRDGVQALPSLR